MKAAQIEKYGNPRAIVLNDVAIPKITPDRVIIEVYASSINPIDTILREGYLRKAVALSLPVTLGYDVAGIVVEVGQEVKEMRMGDRVYGQASILAGATGAFAEFACVPAQLVSPLPSKLSFVQSAAFSLAGLSALQALKDLLHLQSTQRILIHGGSGGIGSIAIQMAKKMGAHVAVTATGAGVDFARRLGADDIVDYREQSFARILSDYDVVLDTRGGRIFKRSHKVLRQGGKIVSLHEQPNSRLMKKFGVQASYLQTRTTPQHLRELTEFIERTGIMVSIDRTYPLAEIQEAFEAKENEQILGKIAIEVRKQTAG